MIHKPISKRTRQLVYAKYDGHCAYCGCKLGIKDMQVDHINSVFKMNNPDDSLENLNPSCRQCNYYKQEASIEEYRERIQQWLEKTCRKSFQVQLAEKYGILEYHEWESVS